MRKVLNLFHENAQSYCIARAVEPDGLITGSWLHIVPYTRIEASQIISTYVILFLLPSASVSGNENEITLVLWFNTINTVKGTII